MVAKAGLGVRIKTFSWAGLGRSNPLARAPAQIYIHETDQDKAQPETSPSIRKEHSSFLDPFSKECSPHTNHQGRPVGLASFGRETFPTRSLTASALPDPSFLGGSQYLSICTR